MATDNVKRFPNNVFPPEKRDGFVIYTARFNSLADLYNFLKSDPDINRDIFYTLHSVENSFDFAGKPYEEAVEDLLKDYDPKYQEFLELQKGIDNAYLRDVHIYKTVKTVAGGHLNIPDYCAGAPLCYETEEKIKVPKFIRCHAALSYSWTTSKSQIFNRAIIITNVLKALEKAGYNVELNTFELSEIYDEKSYIVINIKKYGKYLDMSSLYKVFCRVEFLRRILFRVLETQDVTYRSWNDGYGSTCSESTCKSILNFGDKDIFFDQARNMGIYGDSLEEDFNSALEELGIDNLIDTKKLSEEFNKGLVRVKGNND